MSLARAVLHDPEMMLLDEPFSNVDVHSARDMVRLLARLARSGQDDLRGDPPGSADGGAADEFVRMAAGKIVARTAN